MQPSLWEGSSNILLEALSCNKRMFVSISKEELEKFVEWKMDLSLDMMIIKT